MFDPDRPWTRREFLKLAGQAGLLSTVPTLASAAAALNPDTVCISILHTTDLHGHILPTSDYDGNRDRGGLARCAAQIRRWQRENPNSILIDVGDVYQGTDVSLRNKGALMIDLLNHLEYDAWVVGNHEFDWGMECFEHALQQSNMPVLAAITRAKRGGANAIVLTGHMGLKTRTGGDDFANTVMALTSEFPEVAVFIAGHTHQDVQSRLTNGVLFTQADHFGIHVGRVDLLFDRNSKKLLHREAMCELMDNRFGCDQMVLSRSKSHLAESSAAVSEPIGELAETLRGRSHAGRPSDVERLIGTAIMEMLQERNVPVDGVMHGTFDDKADLIAGPKTVNDVWDIIPFENYVVTAQLSPEEIKISMEDVFASREKRNLLGFELKTEGRRDDCKIVSMALANRQPLDRNKKYVIALNSFDARSGGHHFMKLRAFLERPEANCILHPVQTRDALIGYFQHHKIVHRMAAVNPLAIAA